MKIVCEKYKIDYTYTNLWFRWYITMNILTKNPFLISIIGIILVHISFFVNKKLENIFIDFLSEHFLIWSGMIILWLLIGAVWNTKDKNTILLKKSIIILEIYFFLLIFLKPTLHLSHLEFFVGYSAMIGLVYESTFPRFETRKKRVFTIFYTIIIVFLISVEILVPYRIKYNEESFINQQEYRLISVIQEEFLHSFTQIKLLSIWNKKEQNIPFQNWTQYFLLDKDTDYTLSFSTKNNSSTSYLLLQSPYNEYIQIFPQSQISFSTKKSEPFLWKNQQWSINYFSSWVTLPEEIQQFNWILLETKKRNILKNLPNRLLNNHKLQKISIQYTFLLAKVFPFWYQNNAKILKSYLPYLKKDTIIEHKDNILEIKTNNKLLYQTTKFWYKNIEWMHKYLKYLQDFF